MTYSGSPNSYFRQLPDLDYPSLRNDRTSAFDFEIVKNLFKRAVLRQDVINDVVNFTKYSVRDDERPDQIAYDFYRDAGLDWVILTTNNILHVRDEWPMGNQDFLTYLNAKYTEAQLANIHHYETKIIRDSSGTLIQPEGKTVPAGYTVNFLDNGSLRSESSLTSFSFLEHETNLNDAKRNINILRSEYLSLFLEDMSEIMEYKPSKQFVTESLKKTENPRLISP